MPRYKKLQDEFCFFQAMNVIVRIVYLDRSVKDDISVHDFPEESAAPAIHLLYRPGHYDLLYVK